MYSVLDTQCWREAGTDTVQQGEGVLSYLRCTHKRDGESTVIDINVKTRRRDTVQEGRGDVPGRPRKHRLLVRKTSDDHAAWHQAPSNSVCKREKTASGVFVTSVFFTFKMPGISTARREDGLPRADLSRNSPEVKTTMRRNRTNRKYG